MHFPEQVSPVMDGLVTGFTEGFRRASRASEIPIALKYRQINTYFYAAMVPMIPPEDMEAQEPRTEAKLKET